MAFSLNRIQIIGNLGQDAKNDFLSNNTCVTSFSVATTYSYKDKSGERINETTWHGCTGFNLPDFLKEALVKGAKVYVDGRLKKEEWTDKDGNKQKTTKIVVAQIIPLTDNRQRQSTGNDTEEQQGTVGNYDGAAPQNPDDDLPF